MRGLVGYKLLLLLNNNNTCFWEAVDDLSGGCKADNTSANDCHIGSVSSTFERATDGRIGMAGVGPNKRAVKIMMVMMMMIG